MFQPDCADVLLIWWFLLRGHSLVPDEPLVEYRTYPVKSAAATAAARSPAGKRRRSLMTGLWRSLWREAGAPAWSGGRRAAHALSWCACLLHRHWLKHLAWDGWL